VCDATVYWTTYLSTYTCIYILYTYQYGYVCTLIYIYHISAYHMYINSCTKLIFIINLICIHINDTVIKVSCFAKRNGKTICRKGFCFQGSSAFLVFKQKFSKKLKSTEKRQIWIPSKNLLS
jgi:hypothetical protein